MTEKTNHFDADFARKRILFYAFRSYLQLPAFFKAVNDINIKLYGKSYEEDNINNCINIETLKKYIYTKRKISKNYYELLCGVLMISKYPHPEETPYINAFNTWYSKRKLEKIPPTPKEILIYFKDHVPNSILERPTFNEFYVDSHLKTQLEAYSTETLNLFYCDMDYILETMDNNDVAFIYCYTALNNHGTSLVSELLGKLAKDANRYQDEAISYYTNLLKNSRRQDYVNYDFKEIQDKIITNLHQAPLDYSYSIIKCLNVYNKLDREGRKQLIKFRQYYKTLELNSLDPKESIKQILHFMDTLTVIP